jgi:glycosyltransferase involved in cell wall biosynthesis
MGGQQLYTSALAQRLSSEGMEVRVITRKIEASSKDFEQIGNVRVHRITPQGVLKGRGWKALFPILKLMLKMFYILTINVNKYDILMVVSLKVLSIPAVITKTIFRKKCIIAVISPSELQEDILSDASLEKMKMSRTSAIVKLIRQIRNPLVKRTDCFVGLSNEIKQQFIRMGVSPEKIKTIPNGIDINKFSPVTQEEKLFLRSKLNLPTDKIIFCYTGRIARTKGIMMLAQVWKEIAQKYNNVFLLFVGSGKNSFDDCENELREFIKNNELNRCIFATGRVDETYVYLQASDVFVFPSDYEGFGFGILEGMACGLPAVLTRVGAALEVVEDRKNAVLVNPKDPGQLCSATKWILENKSNWDEIGKNARKSIEPYSVENEVKMYVDMFTNISQSK